MSLNKTLVCDSNDRSSKQFTENITQAEWTTTCKEQIGKNEIEKA